MNKTTAKIFAFLCLAFASTNVFSFEPVYKYYPMQGKYLWSVGFDIFGQYAEPRQDFHQVMRSTAVGATLYVADRFNNPFGFEVGYSWTTRKPKGFTTVAGQTDFYTVATVTSTQTAKIRLADTYIDLHGHWPICKYVEGKIALGVGFVRESIGFTSSPSDGGSMQATVNNILPRTGITGRLGIGMQALLIKRVGLRLMFRFETTSNVKVRGTPPGMNPQLLHDSGAIDFGIYWTFEGLRALHQIPSRD